MVQFDHTSTLWKVKADRVEREFAAEITEQHPERCGRGEQ